MPGREIACPICDEVMNGDPAFLKTNLPWHLNSSHDVLCCGATCVVCEVKTRHLTWQEEHDHCLEHGQEALNQAVALWVLGNV